MVLYPNREIDIQRDAVFSEHIAAIAMKITPGHPKLQIPAKYCRECPWPSAQEEARLIAVYRTPQEKMTQTSRLCKVKGVNNGTCSRTEVGIRDKGTRDPPDFRDQDGDRDRVSDAILEGLSESK